MTDAAPDITSRNNADLFGHELIEDQFIRDVAQSRLHHAYLLCGMQGIGKATFAYRLARYLLSQEAVRAAPIKQDNGLFGEMLAEIEPEAPLQDDASGNLNALQMDASEPVFKRVAQASHTDLLVLSPDYNTKKATKTRDIKVDQARKVGDFLALTPAESSHRVVIIDAVDDLNQQASNALLKILEEPPENSVLLLVCHHPEKLLPTIISRCQKINFSPLSNEAFSSVLSLLSQQVDDETRQQLYYMANGSVGQALQLLRYDGVAIYRELLQAMRPSSTLAERQQFAGWAHGLKDESHWRLVVDLWRLVVRQIITTEGYLQAQSEQSQRLTELRGQYPIDRWMAFYDEVQAMLRQGDVFHLERQQTVMAMLSPKQLIRHQAA